MRVSSPLGWLFAIRAESAPATQVVLWTAFLAGVFGLWVFATDYPQWMKRLIIDVFPHYQVRRGDVIELRLDRDHQLLKIIKGGSGRTISRDLPPLAAAALPEFTPANYDGLFRRLGDDGLGAFERQDDWSYTGRIVDADRAGERLKDLGPLPYQLPVSMGETVDVAIDAATGQALFRLERVPVGGVLAPLEIPAAEPGTPARPDQYPGLAGLATAIGVADLRASPQPEGKRLFQGTVSDAQRAQAAGLGPRSPVAPLAGGDIVSLRLDRDTENPAGHRVVLGLERTGKSMPIPFTPALLTPTAIPPLSTSAYPGLAPALSRVGVGSAPGSGNAAWQVLDVERAQAAGLGLSRPPELRLLSRGSLPSPSELIDSLPVLWSERNLPGAAWLTLSRILQGFAWAVVVTLPLGLLMGAFTRIGMFFDPLRLTGMYIPLPALIPLTIAWVGIGEPQIVLFLAICMGVVLLPFVVAAVQAVPSVYLDTARTLGASRGQIFRYVLVAISWPTLFRGLRISFAVGWTWIMLAEVVGVNNGLGYIINTSQRRGYIEHVYLVIALVIAMAFLSNALWNLLSRVLFPYQESEG